MKSRLTSIGRTLPATCILAQAILTPAPAPAGEQALELEPVLVVSASRALEDADKALASVSVISTEDIRHSAAQDLLELLRLEAGLDVVRSGGAGGQTSVFMRGANSNHTLVMIDGVRVASANTGAYAWEHLPLNQVERIEIVRGPRASLFGSDALGGVIHVFTRQADESWARATSGSDAAVELEAGTTLSVGEVRWTLSAGYRETDGFSSQNPDGFSFHPDDDGFESRNIGVGGQGPTSSGEWTFRLLAMDNEVEFDEGVSLAEQASASAGFDGVLGNGWDYRAHAGYAREVLASDFGFFTTGFESSRFEAGWLNRAPVGSGQLSFGIDYHSESGLSEFSYDESRHNTGLFAMWEQPIAGDSRLQVSTRHDDNSLFGSEFTHQAAISLPAGRRGELVGLWGTGFRAPNLNEQYSPGFGGLFAGNPLLQPELSDSLELMYRAGLADNLRLSLSAYQTDVDGLIAYSGPDFQAVNVNEATMRGFEMELTLDHDAWSMTANATLQKTEDRSTGVSLLRRPDQKGSLRLNRDLGDRAWLGGEWFVSGDRLDVGGVVLPGYALLNLSAGYRVGAVFSLELRLDNLLDKGYELASGFNTAGRSAFLSLQWER